MSDTHEDLVERSINELDVLSDNGYHEIATLDTGQRAISKQDPLVKKTEKFQTVTVTTSSSQSATVIDEFDKIGQYCKTPGNNLNKREPGRQVGETIVFTASPLYQHLKKRDESETSYEKEDEMPQESRNETSLLSDEDTE